LPVAAVACLLLLLPGDVLAVGTYDQRQTGTSGYTIDWIPGVELAQTFTAGITGKLDTIAINANGSGASVTIEIESAVAVPTGAVLDKQSQRLNDTGWTQIALKTPPNVVAGGHYAIVITKFTDVGWNGVCSNAYSGGGALVFDTSAWYTVPGWAAANGGTPSSYCAQDYAFKTYVTKKAVAPPPTAKPTVAPTAAPTAIPAATPVAPASAAASASASAAPTDAVLGATGAPVASQAAGSPGSGSSGSSDMTLPIVGGAAVAAALVVGLLGFTLGRRRRPTT
jgi:hypothetical protein